MSGWTKRQVLMLHSALIAELGSCGGMWRRAPGLCNQYAITELRKQRFVSHCAWKGCPPWLWPDTEPSFYWRQQKNWNPCNAGIPRNQQHHALIRGRWSDKHHLICSLWRVGWYRTIELAARACWISTLPRSATERGFPVWHSGFVSVNSISI